MALVERSKLDPMSAEYRDIAQRFNSKYIVKFRKCEILSIERVRNEALEQRFRNKRQEYEDTYGQVKIVKGWHGTKKGNVASILQNNFDVSTNAGKRHRFGPGVSFSSLSSYAYNYCDKTSEACMLLVDVLVSNVVEVPERKDRRTVLRAPPCLPGSLLRYDTTAKNKDRMDVFVKADKDAFLPTHVVHFKRGAAEHAPPRTPRTAPARARTQAAGADLDLLMESLSLDQDYDDGDLLDHMWSYDTEDHFDGDDADLFLDQDDSNYPDYADLFLDQDDSNYPDYADLFLDQNDSNYPDYADLFLDQDDSNHPDYADLFLNQDDANHPDYADLFLNQDDANYPDYADLFLDQDDSNHPDYADLFLNQDDANYPDYADLFLD